jgi:hypothetical protein
MSGKPRGERRGANPNTMGSEEYNGGGKGNKHFLKTTRKPIR